MKNWYGGVLVVSFSSLFLLLILRYGVLKNSIGESYLTNTLPLNTSNPLEWVRGTIPPSLQRQFPPENVPQVISSEILVSSLFTERNFSGKELSSLQTWSLLKQLLDNAQSLPNAVAAIKEATSAWSGLMASVEEERSSNRNESSFRRAKEKQCPHFLNKMNATEPGSASYILRDPCGLTQGSSITVIGIPNGLLGDFRIDLTGEPLPGEPEPPIVLHSNIRLLGDQTTEDPVIVQNTWTATHDWGDEERCPSPDSDNKKGTVYASFSINQHMHM